MTTTAPQAIPEKKEEQLIFSARDKLFEAISHTNCEDKFLLERAFEFAKKAHYRQYRQSGDGISRILATSGILLSKL